jgi:hypothetical protein
LTAWTAGLAATLGAEWFVASRISLTAEYLADLTYSRTTEESTSETLFDSRNGQIRTTEDTSDDWRLGLPTVRFGVTVYL